MYKFINFIICTFIVNIRVGCRSWRVLEDTKTYCSKGSYTPRKIVSFEYFFLFCIYEYQNTYNIHYAGRIGHLGSDFNNY